jgi:cystathionine gamma-synthase
MSSPTTKVVRAGIASDAAFGAIVPPLYLSANFEFAGFATKRAYDYTRTANPTRDLLAGALAELEQGAGAVVTASGIAAIQLVLQLVPAGALVVAPHDGYGGTWRLLQAQQRMGRLRVQLADLTDLAAVRRACAERPFLVWIETPSNPLLRVTDVAAVAALAHEAGALVAADNTFLSPIGQQPLALGADLVVHSTTKYVNGHSDVVGGAVIANSAELHEQLAWWANCTGLGGAPFDAWLTLRGLRTLPARIRLHEQNARAVARRLQRHPAVARVHWPGLASHPQHALAKAQQRGFGAIVSFELAGGGDTVPRFVERLRCFSLAESLGGVESLVAHPATMTHAAMSPQARAAAGIGDGLLRLSIGIEDPDDLVADLEQALEAASLATRRS